MFDFRYVTLTDRNTLYLQQYYELDNASAARTAIYTREESLLPETLTLALTDEPDKSLMFYWRDPPAEVAQPLAAIPMTALEKGGQNKLLLVGRWYETDIQFCTGRAEQNEDGTLGEWITDKVLYEGTIRINEPQWFSLTIPEETAKLCLFMKWPWDESWFTWPITDQDPFFVSGSGGPFFGMKTEQLRGKTKGDALKHPNWNMGAKITIDSATLMNKGLELIEAVWLFGLPPEKIQIVVQRQSIVHSAVQFSDNSVIAQLGVPDMRIPIQYALTYPKRVPGVVPELDFAALKVLTFDVADDETFRCLAACKKAIRKGGLGPCAANGANEEAVKLFLEDKIGFLDIGRLVEAVVDSDSFGGDYTLSDVYECDRMAREFVRAHL